MANPDIQVYSPELVNYLEVNNGVKWTNLLIQNTFYGDVYSGLINVEPTNIMLDDVYTFRIVAGFLPKTVDAVAGIPNQQLVIAGTPHISLFSGDVYEYSYPYDEPTTDRYYFVVEATGAVTSGRKAFFIDFRKDWCDIRDEFISKVKNQTFAINRIPVSNAEFLKHKIDSGDYTCPD